MILVTPLLRPLSLLAVLLAPLPLDVARGFFRASRYVSFYYALEVMIVVVPLIQVTMGPLTAGLLTPATFPLCTQLQDRTAASFPSHASLNSHRRPCLIILVSERILQGYNP